MKHFCIFFMASFLLGVQLNAQDLTLEAQGIRIGLSEQGYYTHIQVQGEEILPHSGIYPFITLCEGGRILSPLKMQKTAKELIFSMEGGNQVKVAYQQGGKNALVFEIASIKGNPEALVFGPVEVNINQVIGDIIGVVQGRELAFGMQGLNRKTIAGLPLEYGNAIQEKYHYIGQPAEISVSTIPPYRLAATRTETGAAMQFSVKDRSRKEYRKVQQIDKSLTLPVEGEEARIAGARMAFFGCPASEALERIGAIEVEQGLPHPLFDGEWGKTARIAMQSYLISSFGPEELDFVLEKAQKAGFRTIYHSDPFSTWGHFLWNPYFVGNQAAKSAEEGDRVVKEMVERAAQKGIAIGIHTLSNFTTTNDAYVQPVPSKELLKQGTLRLTSDLDTDQTTLIVQNAPYEDGAPTTVDLFSMPMTLNGLQIDDELISYKSLHENPDGTCTLEGCTRGAFGTTAKAHSKNQPLYKLWDYPYSTFFPTVKLQDEFADRLIQLFNTTGLQQISFDGLEGCMYTGQDDYATARFVTRWWDGLNHNVLNDASNLNHFTWHINTRMNWGEPWGEAMRTGQVANRIKNQDFFRRNLFPRMLGWFLIRLNDKEFECTSLEDLEWALSESAGFDAGYSMSISVRTLRQHGQMDRLLQAIHDWDLLREEQVFTPEQKKLLKDPATEWHLQRQGSTDSENKSFLLYPLYISQPYRCNLGELQPGQKGGADWNWERPNLSEKVPAHYGLRLRVEGDGEITNPTFTTPLGTLRFPCTLSDGQYLLYNLEGEAVITDKNYNTLQTLIPEGKALLSAGSSAVSFSCQRAPDDTPTVTIRYITPIDVPWSIQLK